MVSINWRLIGCGDIARKRIAPALRNLPSCRLLGVARSRSTEVGAFAREFGIERCYRSWEKLVADPDIQAVCVATPAFLHAPTSVAAAKAGKHVLCEKPRALSVQECDEMIAACREKGVRLGLAYYRRFYPVLERIKKVIASGRIGKPTIDQVKIFALIERRKRGSHAWMLDKEKAFADPMFIKGCHRIEMLRNLFGPVEKAIGVNDNLYFRWPVDDGGAAVLLFNNKVLAQIEVTDASFQRQETLDIYATGGSIHLASLDQGELRLVTADGEERESHTTHANVQKPLI